MRNPLMPGSVVWCLRITVALQCVGLAVWSSRTETPVFETLCYTWEWPEDRVLAIETAAAYGLWIAAVAVVLAPALSGGRISRALQGVALLAVASWQAVIAAAAWHQAIGLPTGYIRKLIFAEQAVRIGAPVAMALACCAVATSVWLLRLCAALTFFAHGYEAVLGYPPFVDLILAGARRIGWSLAESSATTVLWWIGLIDLFLAALVLCARSRSVAAYMAIWGLVTASSRMVHSGSGAYFETLLRAANCGVPLALLLYWITMHRVCDADKAAAPATIG